MNFGKAIEALKNGEKVARNGWNGKGMYLTLIPAGNAMYQGYSMQDCIGMKTADNNMQPGWLASQADILAEDWEIVEVINTGKSVVHVTSLTGTELFGTD